MKITSINYQKTFNLGNYQSERVGCEIQLDEGDSASGLLDTARSIVENWHQVNNPQLYGDQPPENPATVPTEKPVERPKDQVAGIIFDIASVTDLKVLDTYKFIIKQHPDIKAAYEQKYSELYIQSTTNNE